MAERKIKEPKGVFTLGWQLLIPYVPLMSFCFFLIGTIMTHQVFGFEIGRHVEMGSTLGFQGPSYFYVTGIFSYICAFLIFVYILLHLGCMKISCNKNGVHLLDKRLIRKRTQVSHAEVKALLFRRFPSSSMIFKALLITPYLAFIVLSATLNFRVPYIEGIPITGITLALFAILITLPVALSLVKPGLRVVLLCESRKIVLNFPGILSQKIIISAFQDAFKDLIPMDNSVVNQKGKKHFLKKLAFSAITLGFGIYQLVELLSVSTTAILNQASAWILILLGSLMMLRLLKEKNSLHQDMRVNPAIEIKTKTTWFKHDFWSGFLVFAAALLLFLALGQSIASWAVAEYQFPLRLIYLALIACAFLGISTVLSRLPDKMHVISLDRGHTARITEFGLKIMGVDKKSRFKELSSRVSPFSLFICVVSLVTVIASAIL
ncbi:MAG: hypothetical protein ACFFCS_20615 [Candidatus Hodarchaeota archaeon]